MIIKDLNSLKNFLKENIKTPIFGVGVYAFNRLGPEEFIDNYRLLCLRYSLDTELIEKDIELLSLEKGMGTKHLRIPRNSTSVLAHPKTKDYIEEVTAGSHFRQAFIPYKASPQMEQICQKNNWLLIIPSYKFGKPLFENKIKFRKILEELEGSPVPGEITEVESLNYQILSQKYGLPFVIQHPTQGGGKGTFFINNYEGFIEVIHKLSKSIKKEEEGAEPTDEVIVAKFIKGPSPSITGCVTKHGILSTNPQYQLLDIPELYNPKKGAGLFCGHDWTASDFDQNIQNQAYQMVDKVGRYFQKQGYKGIFGLDFVLDKTEQKIYVTECNPRLLGSFPTLTMVQLMNNEPPIIAFHILEFLNIDYQINLAKINCLMRQKKQGTHMFLHNLTGRWARNCGEIKPGVYRLNSRKNLPLHQKSRRGGLQYLRAGYKLSHLKRKNEFLITEGVPFRKSHFSPNRRLCRILTLRQVTKNDLRLNAWGKEIVAKTYQALDLRPVEFAKVIKVFKPGFLAKG